MKKNLSLLVFTIFSVLGVAQSASAQTLTLQFDKATRQVSPTLYGMMTEEINYAYEGGLYAQLLRDVAIREMVETPRGQRRGGWGQPPRLRTWLATDTLQVQTRIMNNALVIRDSELLIDNTRFTRHNALSIHTEVDGEGVTNAGFWGIRVDPASTYLGSLYIKGVGNMTVSLVSADKKSVYASQTIDFSSSDFSPYDISLTTSTGFSPTKDAIFSVTFKSAGDYQIAYPTLFPTEKRDGKLSKLTFRQDIMQLMKDMHPKFLRFPGGNYLEGNKFNERFDWKRTIGPLALRPGHQSPWGYWSTDGMGLLEFLCWAEECGAEPILGVFAGYVLGGDFVEGDAVKPFITEALEEIEYVIGGPDTKWGARRALDGHPAPFPLHYVEIGNEDFFDRSGSYSNRFEQFYEAIKAKYPQLQIISTLEERRLRAESNDPEGMKVDVIDEHYYRNTEGMYKAAQQYDTYDRQGPKIFCGEWASREGDPTTNMNAALGDAAWMTCMERNSDILVAHCYAPLFVNVSRDEDRYPGMQWKSDLIGYDAFSAFGSPSYYAQSMFASYLGDKVIPIEAAGMPQMQYGQGELPQLYYVATLDSNTGRIYLKVVNGGATAVSVKLQNGSALFRGRIQKIELKASGPEETNTIDNPTNIVPKELTIKLPKTSMVNIAPYSINVLVIG